MSDSLFNSAYDSAKSLLEQEVASDEGYREHLYKCTAGKLTIGYGTNVSAGLPQDDALVLLRYRLSKIDAILSSRFPWYDDAPEVKRRALCNMAYQLGIDGLLAFKKMLAECSVGNWVAAADHALDSKWAKYDTPARALRIAQMFQRR